MFCSVRRVPHSWGKNGPDCRWLILCLWLRLVFVSSREALQSKLEENQQSLEQQDQAMEEKRQAIFSAEVAGSSGFL